MKVFKRFLLIVVLLLTALIVFASIGFGLSRKRPAIYRPYRFDLERQKVINQKAVDKLIATRNMVAANWSKQVQAQRAGTTVPAADPPRTITFSEEELNAFLQHNFADALSAYVKEPGIFLTPGRLVLAGEVPQVGSSVVSFHFAPTVEAGNRLRMTLANTYLGSARVPRAMFSSHLEKVRATLEGKLPGYQQSARIDLNGMANEDAAKAAGAKLLLSILDDTATDNVIFLADERNRHLPMRLTDVQIDAEGITLTVQPTAASERQEILAAIKSNKTDTMNGETEHTP